MNRSDWADLLSRQEHPPHVVASIHLDGPGPTWSAPIKIGASDGETYWVKTREGCQAGGTSLAIEQVLGRAAQLIGVSVVSPQLIMIPGDGLGIVVRGAALAGGYAHGSRAVGTCFERRQPPEFRSQDENARRHVGLYLLYDWAFGADLQYLYDTRADSAAYSHDHGLYLGSNGRIDVAVLEAHGASCPLPGWASTGLSTATIDEMATRLEELTSEELVGILNLVPLSWPVTDEQLEAVGWFLFERSTPATQRLRALGERRSSWSSISIAS